MRLPWKPSQVWLWLVPLREIKFGEALESTSGLYTIWRVPGYEGVPWENTGKGTPGSASPARRLGPYSQGYPLTLTSFGLGKPSAILPVRLASWPLAISSHLSPPFGVPHPSPYTTGFIHVNCVQVPDGGRERDWVE